MCDCASGRVERFCPYCVIEGCVSNFSGLSALSTSYFLVSMQLGRCETKPSLSIVFSNLVFSLDVITLRISVGFKVLECVFNTAV